MVTSSKISKGGYKKFDLYPEILTEAETKHLCESKKEYEKPSKATMGSKKGTEQNVLGDPGN